MKKTALLLVITMLVSVFAGYGAVSAETTEVVNGPQATPFSVSATEPTTLSGVRFTKTNTSDGSWSNGSYCTLEAYSYTQRYVSYDLDVEKAGAYRVTVRAVAYSDGTIARLYRQGRGTQTTGDLGGGDVVLAEVGLKSTDGVWSPQDNDFGVIYLEEGSNQIAISSLSLCAKSFYFLGMTLTPVDESAPLVFGLRDAKEMNAGESLISNLANHAVPFISFGGSDYQIYDVTIPEDGLYSFTAYGSYSHKLTLTDITDAENPVELVTDAVTASTGTGSSASPAEVAKIDLKAGTYTYKLTNGVSSHYSYFTLKKIADPLGDKVSFIPTGETVKVDRTLYSVSTGGAGLDFGYGGYREYKVYAETEGFYDFILNYATTGATTMTVAVDGVVKANKALDARANWADYADVTIGTIKLNAGLNTLKLTPGDTMNMPRFTLVPSVIATIKASECTNVATDALATMSANGGTAVKLTEGQKLDFTFTAPTDALYDFTVNASITKGKRLVYISEGEDDLIDAEITGAEHGNWKSIYVGSVELAAGEHNLSFRLDEGYDSYFDKISISSEEIEVPEPTLEPTEEPTETPTPEPSGKGPQDEAFPVSATEATEFTATVYTKAGVSGVAGWYDLQNFATLDVADYTHHYVAYEIDVKQAGAYRVTASIGAPTKGSVAQLVRTGKNVPESETNSYATETGDVVLSKVSLKESQATSPAENDFGVIWLDEGVQRLAIANVRDEGKAIYYHGMTITPVDEEAPIVVSVRDAKELTASDGSAKPIYGYAASFTAIAPYIQFFGGDYQIYDVEIPTDGLYSFTTFQGGGNAYTLTDITDEETPVTLVNNAAIPSSGVTNYATPYEVAELALTKGVHTLKLSASQSNHYSYFTLRRLGDIPTEQYINLPIGENVKVAFDAYSDFEHSAALDFTDVDPATGEIVESWREYTVNAEQAGDYKLTVNYATPNGAGIIIEVNGEEIAAEELEETETYGSYTDFEIPYNLSLNEGMNVIRIIPEGTFNMPHFVLTQLSAKVYNASAAENVAGDELDTMGYNDGTSVKLKAGQKLNITVEADETGFYVLRSLVSSTLGYRAITVKNDDEVVLETTLSGQQNAEYENVTLGMIYLKKGKNAITISLDAGYYAYFNNISIGKVAGKLYDGDNAISNIVVGDITAKVDLANLYAGETKTVYFAVYETDENGATRLAYINMEEKEIKAGEDLEISVTVAQKNAGCTYSAKVFIWDDMNGFYHVF